MADRRILVRGAREHNLKNIDVEIPRDRLVVITGLSGSGKSSLAFDTIYAEGQRRYVESLSAYARQFLGLMEKPDVDAIEGLSPAISIQQRSPGRNPRSTVATVTELYDYLRLLYARIGVPHCYACGKAISRQSVQQMVDAVLGLPEGTKVQILAPMVRGRKGEYQELFERVRRDGYVRMRVDGELVALDTDITLDKNRKHTIEVVVDRLVITPAATHRLADSMEVALRQGNGVVTVDVLDGAPLVFSEQFACIDCGISLEEIEPRSFSFNSPYGACPACTGLGNKPEVDPDRVVPDPSRSINEGALAPFGLPRGQWFYHHTRALARHFGFDFDTPFGEIPEDGRRALLYGTGREKIKAPYQSRSGKFRGEYHARFEGTIPNLERRYRETQSADMREQIERYMSDAPCPECGGLRLRKETLAVTVRDRSIAQLTALSVKEAQHFFEVFEPTQKERQIAHQVLKEIRERLGFLMNVGLDYLTLDRATGTLSGGEAQRIHLATQIGSQLTGVLYILDEPSIGLHQRDNKRLLRTLLDLRDLGNTVLVVEHDRETIETADYLIDLGPGAGRHGGEVVVSGSQGDVARCRRSLTGQYLSGQRSIPVPEGRRPGRGEWLSIRGAVGNNLKHITVDIPLGTFTCVTGVSGSGKSTLVNETLYRALARKLQGAKDKPHPFDRIEGIEYVDKVIDIDQSPIGRTPRSNPATYTGAFTPIRQLFAQAPAAKVRGYTPGRFSFNVKGGRCETCQGAGILRIEMHFLPDVYVTCEVCKGKRYNRETLEVLYKGRSIADVLDMTVDEALTVFEAIPAISRKLRTITDVGLGYVHLGQQATTLSGGEAQRVKLASELSKVGTGRTLYILDEPTTGLHFEDIRMLLGVLGRLVEKGNTVLVVEHNLDVIKTADYLIDLGPEGGDAGGEVVGSGTPEELANVAASYTGAFLKGHLGLED